MASNAVKPYPQKELLDFLKDHKNLKWATAYAKTAGVHARVAEKEEEIVTNIGTEKETKNVAKIGDYIILNPSGEKYVNTPKEFKKRYEKIDDKKKNIDGNEWLAYKSTGKIRAIEVTDETFNDLKKQSEQGDGPFVFVAPWGENMICNVGDCLATPEIVGEPTQVYRIESKMFLETYSVIHEDDMVPTQGMRAGDDGSRKSIDISTTTNYNKGGKLDALVNSMYSSMDRFTEYAEEQEKIIEQQNAKIVSLEQKVRALSQDNVGYGRSNRRGSSIRRNSIRNRGSSGSRYRNSQNDNIPKWC